MEGGVPLDSKRFKDVERLWRSVVGDPREANAPAIVSLTLTMREAQADPSLLRCPITSLVDPYDAVRLPNGRERVWINTDASGFEAHGVLTGFDHLVQEAYVAWGGDSHLASCSIDNTVIVGDVPAALKPALSPSRDSRRARKEFDE